MVSAKGWKLICKMFGEKIVYANVSNGLVKGFDLQFIFDPPLDLLLTDGEEFIGVTLKVGISRRTVPPDEYNMRMVGEMILIAYLQFTNPVYCVWRGKEYMGGLLDYSVVVFTSIDKLNFAERGFERVCGLCKILGLGLYTLDSGKVNEWVKPRRNPYCSREIKEIFKRNLIALNPFLRKK